MYACLLIVCILISPSQNHANKGNGNKGNETKNDNGQGRKGEALSQRVGVQYFVSQPEVETAQQQPYDAKSDSLYRAYLRATIIGVAGGLIGIGILVWQVIITRTAANAAKSSADALVASERAWIHAELVWSETESRHEPDESEDFLFCSLLYSNRGKTLCWIFEKSIHVVVAANIDRLPKEPRFENDIYTQRVYETEPIYPDTPQRESRFKPKRPNKGREEMLFIYGVIKYRDVFMSGSGYKETRFGYMTKDLFKLERMIGHYEYNKNT
jgi:hypothetical protein